MTQWTMQLSTLLGAGLPLVRSLRILEGQMPAGPFRDVLRKVSEDVEGGESLSESFARHPGVFDRLTVHMARAGEAGGILDQILARLAGFLERSERLRGRVVGALLYPAVVLAVAGLVLVLVLTFLVPKFREIFKQFGQELPPITQALLALSNFLQSWWWALLLGLVGLAVLGRIFVRMPGGRAVADRARLSMPLFGPLVRGTLVARFARTLGTLLQSGVPILDALQIVRGSVPNATLERALDGVSASVREGEGIAPALGRSGVFDDLVVNMIAVGEETGELDRMLLKIADIFEEQVDQRVQNLFRVLEPVILVALAVVVGLVVFAIFLPLVQLLEALHG
jgi:type IV pilus assembly protein PilC